MRLAVTGAPDVVLGSPYDVSLGRLRFPTMLDDVKEAVGDTLDASGAVVVAGQRRARPFVVTLPVESLKGDPDVVGERLRRQVRSMLENPEARLQALYFRFRADPDLNGWLLIGGGDLDYADGGPTFHRYELSLSDAYRVASLRTHRPARRIEVYDRRLATIPRDTRGTLYAGDFATTVAQPLVVLPPGATDVLVNGAVVVPSGVRTGIDGDAPLVAGGPIALPGAAPSIPTGSVISYEQAETDLSRGAVVILDRRGVIAPPGGFTPTGDQTEQDAYGWEEVYGPDHPLTAGDVPVIRNSFVRVRWDAQTAGFVLERFVVGAGYREIGRAYLNNVSDGARYTILRDARVVEWSPERGVLRATLANTNAVRREEVVVTLERGWLGPRIEVYRGGSGADVVELVYVPKSAGTTTFIDPQGTTRTSPTWGPFVQAYTFPYASLFVAGDAAATTLASVLAGAKTTTRTDAIAYGATRYGVGVAPAAGTAYLSVHLALTRPNSAPDTGAFDGPADVPATVALLDTRAIPELVAR